MYPAKAALSGGTKGRAPIIWKDFRTSDPTTWHSGTRSVLEGSVGVQFLQQVGVESLLCQQSVHSEELGEMVGRCLTVVYKLHNNTIRLLYCYDVCTSVLEVPHKVGGAGQPDFGKFCPLPCQQLSALSDTPPPP